MQLVVHIFNTTDTNISQLIMLYFLYSKNTNKINLSYCICKILNYLCYYNLNSNSKYKLPYANI